LAVVWFTLGGHGRHPLVCIAATTRATNVPCRYRSSSLLTLMIPAHIEQCSVPVDVSVALLTVCPVLRSVVLDTDPQILIAHIDSGNEVPVFVENPDLRLRSRQTGVYQG